MPCHGASAAPGAAGRADSAPPPQAVQGSAEAEAPGCLPPDNSSDSFVMFDKDCQMVA